MNEKKNIDKLFKEQLKNFEVAPNDAVWENIEQELHNDKRKKRRIIPMWWKLAGVAAIIAVFFTVGNLIFNESSENGIHTNTVVDDTTTKNNATDDETTENHLNDASKELYNVDASDEVTTTNDTSGQTDVEDVSDPSNTLDHKDNYVRTSGTNKTTDAVVASDNILQKKNRSDNNQLNNAAVTPAKETNSDGILKNSTQSSMAHSDAETNGSKSNKNPLSTKKDSNAIDAMIEGTKHTNQTSVAVEAVNEAVEENNTSTKEDESKDNAIEKAIAEAEDSDEKEIEEEKRSRWSISPNVAPVYFSSLGKKGSSLDDQFIDNTKEGDVNMSYGINGGYAISKKLKVRAGVNKVQLGYKTDNILIFDNAVPVGGGARQIANVTMTDSMSNHSIYSARNFKFSSVPANLFTKEQGSIDQELGFIEVPVELEYNLVDNKLGLSVVGGFSTLFLSENDVYLIENNGERTRLGEASNIKEMSYSANFGIGIDYNITKQLQINLEPKFKYQINTFNNTSGDFKPFFIGVYSGLSFKF